MNISRVPAVAGLRPGSFALVSPSIPEAAGDGAALVPVLQGRRLRLIWSGPWARRGSEPQALIGPYIGHVFY